VTTSEDRKETNMRNPERTLRLCAVAGLLAAACGCGRAVVPASYQQYIAQDGSFEILYPAEWQASGGGKDAAWAKFTSGGARINVDTDAVGSLLGDLAQAQASGLGGAPKHDPIVEAHNFDHRMFEEQNGVVEKNSTAVKTGCGTGRVSEFTGSAMFGGAIHGYRATALTRDKRLKIVCQCSEAEWESLKPVFDKVIASVANGKMPRP
jgi:hypothetical protein